VWAGATGRGRERDRRPAYPRGSGGVGHDSMITMERSEVMKRQNCQFLAGLAVCALVTALSASAKESVPRPFNMKADSQQVWQLDDDYNPIQMLVAEGWGLATHCGAITMEMYDLTTGAITAANGDQISFFWIPGEMTVTITGGTGRFDGAAGEFTMTVLSQTVTVDPVAMTMTVQLTWTASGTIIY